MWYSLLSCYGLSLRILFRNGTIAFTKVTGMKRCQDWKPLTICRKLPAESVPHPAKPHVHCRSAMLRSPSQTELAIIEYGLNREGETASSRRSGRSVAIIGSPSGLVVQQLRRVGHKVTVSKSCQSRRTAPLWNT